MGCHHKLEQYLDEYIAAAGIADERKGPLFHAAIGKTKKLSNRPMSRFDSWYMIRRRAKNAGMEEVRIANHFFRAIGLTDYIENGGDITIAQRVAHANIKTTQSYDRREDELTFSEIERVAI